MALSFKDKRTLTKTVNAKVEELNAGGLSFKEKRAVTKTLNDAREKLTGDNLDEISTIGNDESNFLKRRGPGNGPDINGLSEKGSLEVAKLSIKKIGINNLKPETLIALATLYAAIGNGSTPNMKEVSNKESTLLLPLVNIPVDKAISEKIHAAVLSGNDSGVKKLYKENTIIYDARRDGEINSKYMIGDKGLDLLTQFNEISGSLTGSGEEGKTSPTLEKLIAGDYDNLPPIKFLAMLEKAVNELDGDIYPVKPPAIKYVSAHAGDMDPIMESAFSDFGFNAPLMGPGQQTPSVWYEPMTEGAMDGPKRIHIDVDHEFYEPQMFRERIRALYMAKEGDDVILHINSPGGRTDAAQAFYVALLETKARTIAKIINAASSGSIIAFACDEIQLTPFCTMMLHNASGGARGKVSDMAASSVHFKEFFSEWFNQLYDGFMTGEEIVDMIKGQEFYMKETDIRERLKNWVPIRAREKQVMEA